MKTSPSIENFLRTLYLLESRKEKTSGTHIAKQLNITPAAVTDMANKLSNQGFITYQKHKYIQLTPEGNEIALKVCRRHRLWETFLHKTLGLDLDEIHAEAELLEHHPSDFLLDKIESFLDYPDYDPHGDPIPDKNNMLPDDKDYTPLHLTESGPYIIGRIQYDNTEVSDFFARYNFKVGSKLELVLTFKMDDALLIKRDKTTMIINKNIASKILVKKIEE